MELCVIIPTHNPNRERLHRALAGLCAQTLSATQWEVIVVDNASIPPLDTSALAGASRLNLRIVREAQLGLTHARQRGFAEARGKFAVLVDDDNVLAPDYLAKVLTLFAAYPHLGALGGRSLPEFEISPPAWVREFDGLLACRDLGDRTRISAGLWDTGQQRNAYPLFAPIGAGMALRRAAIEAWLTDTLSARISDRKGSELTSGGDNDIVFTLMKAGWEVGYFPELSLTHLIPAGRLEPSYLSRLNRGIQKSWMQVLTRHEANPWPPLTPGGAALRKLKAWFSSRAWSSPTARIRWQGTCGHFDGRVPT